MPNPEKEAVSIQKPDQLKFFPVPTGDLALKFGVGETTVRKQTRRVLETEPEQVTKKGEGARSRYSMTRKGMELLRKFLEESSAGGGSRKKVNFIQPQNSVVPPSEPQATISRSPNPNPTLSETIPLYSSLTRKIQLAITCIDELDNASLEEKRALLITLLCQEDVSIQARKETAKILGTTLEEVDETIRKKRSVDEENKFVALFNQLPKLKASGGRNKKSGR